MTLEGYSYRTSSRFGSRVKISINDSTVSVIGPRVGVLTYRLFIAIQVVLLGLIMPSLLAAAVLWDWWYLVLTLALLGAHILFGGIGAASFWEIANMGDHKITSFPVSAVKRVKIGRGWARNGLWIVILPYVAQINKVSEGHVVSFEAPDGVKSGDSVYATYFWDENDASTLATLLEGGGVCGTKVRKGYTLIFKNFLYINLLYYYLGIIFKP